MASNYTELYYHFVWATRERQDLITPEIEDQLYTCIRRRCEALRAFVLALNGTSDHIHLACSLPTSLAVADFIEAIKGASAHFINHLPERAGPLYWQSGYGVLTFSKRDLPQIVRYIDQQKAQHRANQLSPMMERCSDPGLNPRSTPKQPR